MLNYYFSLAKRNLHAYLLACVNVLNNFVVFLYAQRNRWLCFIGHPLAEVDGQQARLCVCVCVRFPVCIVYRTPQRLGVKL